MNAEELLNMDIEDISDNPESYNDEKKRERLSAVIAGGRSKQYLGKEIQLSEIETMKTEHINKLYCKYEAKLGGSMTKTLGNSFINLYVMGVLKYFNVSNPPQLIQDLEEDPFVNHALTNTCCELYYRFGMYLAPFTAMLTTARHIEGRKPDSGFERAESSGFPFEGRQKENIELIEESKQTLENDE